MPKNKPSLVTFNQVFWTDERRVPIGINPSTVGTVHPEEMRHWKGGVVGGKIIEVEACRIIMKGSSKEPVIYFVEGSFEEVTNKLNGGDDDGPG